MPFAVAHPGPSPRRSPYSQAAPGRRRTQARQRAGHRRAHRYPGRTVGVEHSPTARPFGRQPIRAGLAAHDRAFQPANLSCQDTGQHGRNCQSVAAPQLVELFRQGFPRPAAPAREPPGPTRPAEPSASPSPRRRSSATPAAARVIWVRSRTRRPAPPTSSPAPGGSLQPRRRRPPARPAGSDDAAVIDVISRSGRASASMNPIRSGRPDLATASQATNTSADVSSTTSCRLSWLMRCLRIALSGRA
jgi:hypothetical protein